VKNYTRRKNRARRERRRRAEKRRSHLEFVGRCSNCRTDLVVVRLIGGSQLCLSCAKRLPGHLLRKVFPMVQDPGLTKFLRENTVVKSEAVDRPGEDPPAREKTWRDRVRDRVKGFLGRFRRG